MKFYRVHCTQEAGTSVGSTFFASRREAEKFSADWLKENPDELATVEAVEIHATKAGILRALNLHASHPDNG